LIDHYLNRIEAGKLLAQRLKRGSLGDNPIVLALPRGGVPVGFEVAKELGTDLDVLIVRKLGLPNQPEVAMGAITADGGVYINDQVIRSSHVNLEQLRKVMDTEARELARREDLYRGQNPRPNLSGRTVIVVDDGIATGASMKAAIQALRNVEPKRIVLAVPVAPKRTAAAFDQLVDEFICPLNPPWFEAVGQFYDVFDQVDDEEVVSLLRQAT
jgi:putative phosphoribosyl transferase